MPVVPTLPTVHGTGAALYPITRTNTIACNVAKFLNANEQRFQSSSPLAGFELKYQGLFITERDALKRFYETTKGAFNSTWSFTLPATVDTSTFSTPAQTYGSMTFLEDAFQSVEGARPNLYDVTLKFRQTVSGGGIPGAGTTFPLLLSGAACQRPYTQVNRYRTAWNDNPNGPRYSYSFYNSGLSGFPTRELYTWKLEYPSITDLELLTLEAHFIQMGGQWKTFQFTDPDSSYGAGATVYTSVRYGMPAFTYKYLALNNATTSITLEETN